MENIIIAQVYGVSFVSVDNKDYCSVYVGQPSSNPKGYKGIEVMKLSAESDVFHSLKADQTFPVVCELTISLKRVSGGVMGQVCTAIAPVRQAQQPVKPAA